jgi:hypothetical protein
VASSVFEAEPRLTQFAQSRIEHVGLPPESPIADTEWMSVRRFCSYGHMPWAGSRPPLEAFAGTKEVSVPRLPAVTFALEDRKFAPVSWKSGRPTLTLKLGGRLCKKVYVLVIPFLDNHDTFIPAARIDVRTADGALISKTLRFPGDLDWWNPYQVVGQMATAREPRLTRFGLLRTTDAAEEALPPGFPQPAYWASCLPLISASSLMNVIEIDLGKPGTVESISISTLGADPALGVVAVSIEKEGGIQALQGTDFMPPARFRQPTVLWEFVEPGNLLGWRLEGEAFSVAPVPSLFTDATLNSLAKAGEPATGRAISPDFTIGTDDKYLSFIYQGGTTLAEDGPGTLEIRLLDSKTGRLVGKIPASGSHVLREGRIPVSGLAGQTVHLELVDRNTGPSYAWLGVRRVALLAN